MANKILQIDLQNDITPQIGSYDNAGSITPNNWQNEGGVYSLGPTNVDGTTPYYWFTPTKEVTDFDLCWEDYQDHEQTTPQYHLEIGDSAGNVVLSAYRANQNYSIGPVGVGDLAYQTWHKMLVEVRKASASSSTVTAYVDGKKIDTGTSDTLLTSAKIALLGHVPDSYYWQNAGQRLRYVTIYDRSYTSKGINLDGMMTTITALISKFIAKLSTVAFTGSYNDLSNKPTISTVNDGTLTIQQNGTNVQTFTANASTNKTANIQCVDLSTAQTISGQKIFTTSPRVTRAFPDIALNISDCDVTEIPTEAKFASLFFRDKNAKNLAYITGQQRTNGQKRMCLRTHRTDNIDSYYSVDLDSDGDFYPEQNNSLRLGTPALQWKDVYTHNILIDNDINIASSLINKTSNSGVLTIRGGISDTEGASLSLYGKDYGGSPGLIGNIYMTAYGSSDYTNFRIYPSGIIRVYNNSTATTKNVAMQEDTVNLTGNQTIAGVKTFTSNMVIQGGKKVTCNLDNSFIELDGGTTWGKGGSIVLSGQDRSSYTNSVLIVSKSDTNTDILQYQNGELKPHQNNTNNSSLGTSTNKWSKVYSDDVVHTTGNETIDGVKTFNSLVSKSNTLERGSLPTTNINEDPIFISVDKNYKRTLAFFNYYYPNGDGKVVLYTYNQNTTNYDNIGLVFSFSNQANIKSIYPSITETYNLGTSVNKWKSFNGINPGALSLPGASVNVDTTNWVLDGSQPNHFVPTSDGWFGIQCTDTVYDQTHYVFVGRTGGGNTYYQQNVMSPVSALWDSKYHGCIFIPVVKGFNYDIRCICSTITATFYPCQGNV